MSADRRSRPVWTLVGLAAMALALQGCVAANLVGGEPLTAADRTLVRETTQRALEENKIGESSNWVNEERGSRGTVTPTTTFAEDAERPCRDYQQTATYAGDTRIAFDTACRQPDGTWLSVSTPDGELVAEGYGAPHAYRGYYRDYPSSGFYSDPFYYPYGYGYGYPYPYRFGHPYRYGYPYRYRY
jgi:surface antigen